MTNYIYAIRQVGGVGPVKIGVSHWPEERLRNFRLTCPVSLEIVASMPGDEDLEARIHAALLDHHSHGEWFVWCEPVAAIVSEIRDGTLQADGLPQGINLRRRPGWKPPSESAKAAGLARRVNRMVSAGRDVPTGVRQAARTYGMRHDEKRRCWAIVRDFIANMDAAGVTTLDELYATSAPRKVRKPRKAA